MPELPKQAPKNRHHFYLEKTVVAQRFLGIGLRQRVQSAGLKQVF